MFDANRYLTRGIDNSIPPELVVFLWQLIDERKIIGHELDYLQVFNLSSTIDQHGEILQKIEHIQEEPPYQATYTVKVTGEPVHAKIFVIDNIATVTMLLAEEY